MKMKDFKYTYLPFSHCYSLKQGVLRKQKINLPKANEEYAAKNFEMLRG
jgi:hypothetical protein